MPNLFVDFETRSLLNLQENGLDNYSRNAEVLMLGWAIDARKVQLWRPHAGPMPAELLNALNDSAYTLVAHNAQFERTIFHRVLGIWLNYPRWRDTMVLARSWSLPGSLEKICEVLKMPTEDRKADGGDLIDFFCSPAREQVDETLFGSIGRFNDWDSHPEKWKKFEEYCKQDVQAERSLWNRLTASPLPDIEWRGWFLDQKINDKGMFVNRKMVENGLWLAEKSKLELQNLLREKTGLENPNSDEQMKTWVGPRGYPWGSLRKEYVQAELDNVDSPITPDCREVLKLRSEASKRSYKKLERLLQVLGPDDRLRYQFRFGAAARTARWAGGDVQTQNLPRPIKQVKKNYQRAIDLILARDYETITKEYPSVIGMVTSSMRMMFQAPPGKKLVVCDLSAIENRVLGYLAQCPGILEVFENHQDPYISFGAKLYKKSYEELEAEYKSGNEEPRQNAKPAVLGAGYGLGGGEMRKNEFGDMVRGGLWGYAKNMGIDLTQELAHASVKVFRESYPEVVRLWKNLENGFKQVLTKGGEVEVGYLKFDRKKMRDGGYMVRMHLPSGRCLHYLNATLEDEVVTGKDGKPWKRSVIYYDGIEHSASQNDDGSTARRSNKWGKAKTYGGKLTENGDQAFSRDGLLNGMFLADEIGFDLIGLFHDELAAEVDDDPYGLGINDLRQCMSEPPIWALGVPLGAEGFESKFYRK